MPVSGRLSGDASVTPFDNGAAGVTTGIAHGRYTQMPDTMNTVIYDGRAASATASQTGTIYSADYSISFNHNPLYKIGQEFPTCTYYTTASESINISEDIFNSGLTYTGHSRDYVLDIKGLDSSNGGMKVPITAAKQINTTASVGLDDIIRTQKTLTAAYLCVLYCFQRKTTS